MTAKDRAAEDERLRKQNEERKLRKDRDAKKPDAKDSATSPRTQRSASVAELEGKAYSFDVNMRHQFPLIANQVKNGAY